MDLQDLTEYVEWWTMDIKDMVITMEMVIIMEMVTFMEMVIITKMVTILKMVIIMEMVPLIHKLINIVNTSKCNNSKQII